MDSGDAPVQDPQPWQDALATALGVHAQIILTGNTRDLYPTVEKNLTAFLPIDQAIWQVLQSAGFQALLRYDPVNGLRHHPGASDAAQQALNAAGLLAAAPGQSIESIAQAVAALSEVPIALLVDYASHLIFKRPEARDHLLVRIDQIARAPAPRPDGDGPSRNAILWIIDRAGDLPDWFVVDNHTLRRISVDLPDLEERYAYAKKLADGSWTQRAADQSACQTFALQTEGMTLNDMTSIAGIAARQDLPMSRSDEAIRAYRTGIRRNPWTSSVLRDRLIEGRALLENRIKGQDRAIDRTLDILIRSAMGLSGAQTSSRLNRPRGVLFFAGPTGVGKTELAKAVTELLFGNQMLMHRFDMTEFNSERSVARLVGAPPGYAGHDAGGELTNAMNRRPFSVVLFDEVEKAHPRVLDMFLQILDEGRLTDARGETAYFSEAVIIFTSNVGMFGKDQSTNMGMEILPSDNFASLESKLLKGVRNHFRYELRRPELMNRIGQNIVVFDFIHTGSARLIFDAIVGRVLTAVMAEQGIQVTLTEDARAQLSELCIADLFDGGRGIGNRIETNLINPLAQALFYLRPTGSLTVEGFQRDGSDVKLLCR